MSRGPRARSGRDGERWAQVAARQGGVLSRRQALAAGLTDGQIEAQVRAGRWRRLFRPVYVTYSGTPARLSVLWAVVLRAGPGAVLSHQTAAELAGLPIPRTSDPGRWHPSDRAGRGSSDPDGRRLSDPGDGFAPEWPAVHVSVPSTRRVARIPGAVVHICTRIDQARHPTRMPPQTRIEETVLDLAEEATCLDDAFGWVASACAGRLTTGPRLLAAMALRPKLRWRADLLAVLREVEAGCHSPLELRYLRDVERRHGLPVGARQVATARKGGRWYDDVRYPEYRTRIELDGRIAHSGEARWRDMRRDNMGAAAGDVVLRYGWVDVTGSPCAVAAQVATVLRHHGWTGTPRPCGSRCGITGAVGAWAGR